MAFHTGIGISKQIQDASVAGKEAIERAIDDLQGKPQMIILLASSLYNQEDMLAGVRSLLPDVPLVGCTTAGAITDSGIHEEAVAVLALRSDTISFHPVKVENISKDMHSAGQQFGTAVQANEAKLSFIFSDALAGNGTALVRGALSVLGAHFALVGGAAGDDAIFKKTYQYFNDEVLTDAAVGCALSGDVHYAASADHGWQPIGNTREVTKAEGTTLYELDGKPAFAIYEDYFGDKASDFKKALSLAAVSYPLGMLVDGIPSYMVRVPLSVQDDGSIVCGAEVLKGSTISLMLGTVSSALTAAEETTKGLAKTTENINPRLVFLSTCIARKILYGERGRDELEAIQSLVGNRARIFGFYSYGQIAPLHDNVPDINTCDPGFYEQSISITIFGE